MRLDPAAAVLAALVVASGCSKPVAPLATNGSAPRSVLERAAAAGPSSTFRVRLRFVGSTVTLDAAGQPLVDRHAVFDVYGPTPGSVPLDTVPAYSVLQQVHWIAIGSDPAGAASGALEGSEQAEPLENGVGPAGSRVMTPGVHSITLQAPARVGGGTVTVLVFAGFVPSTWWAGPDPDLWPPSSDGDGRAVEVVDWNRFSTLPAWPPDGRGYFGPDSFRTLPSQRRPVDGNAERRTFYEIYGQRIYARSEGDSVHAGAWVAFCNGGFDRDSRYVPKVDPTDPALPAGFASNPSLYPVLLPQGLVGSPSAFRSQVTIKRGDGLVFRQAQSGPYPDFEPASVFRLPQVTGYWPALLAGKVYAVVRSEDSDGLLDAPIPDPVGLADRVDAGSGTPAERLQRHEILTFFVRPEPGSGLVQRARPGAPAPPRGRASR